MISYFNSIHFLLLPSVRNYGGVESSMFILKYIFFIHNINTPDSSIAIVRHSRSISSYPNVICNRNMISQVAIKFGVLGWKVGKLFNFTHTLHRVISRLSLCVISYLSCVTVRAK